MVHLWKAEKKAKENLNVLVGCFVFIVTIFTSMRTNGQALHSSSLSHEGQKQPMHSKSLRKSAILPDHRCPQGSDALHSFAASSKLTKGVDTRGWLIL